MSLQNRRHLQIANAIREELVTIARKDLSDPHLERVGMVTFSQVELSDDFRNCNVYVAFMGKEAGAKDVKAALEALNRSAKFIQRLLIKRLPMKIHPVPNFRFDNGFDRAATVGKALQEAAEVEKETIRQRSLQAPDDSSDESGQ